MMWFQPPSPPTNRWVLHVAATTAQVNAVLRELCIDERQPHRSGDGQFPVYLRGTGSPYGPPQWMSLARAELNRRGYPTRWCTRTCRHHPRPPHTEPQQPTAAPAPAVAVREPDRGSAVRSRPRTPSRRLTSGVPHHRTTAPAQTLTNQPVTT